MKGRFRPVSVLHTVAKFGILVLGLVALSSTGAPYDYQISSDGGRVSELSPTQPELKFQVVICGNKPYTGGGLTGGSERSEIRVFVDESDSKVRFQLRRIDVTDSESLEPIRDSRKIFERNIHPGLVSDGLYCDFETELVITWAQMDGTASVRWHVEAHYLNVLNGSNTGPASIRVEAQP